MSRSLMITIALGFAVCACEPQRPAIDPALASGVTSSNGGGMRQTGAIPSVAVGPAGAVTTRAPSSAGAAY